MTGVAVDDLRLNCNHIIDSARNVQREVCVLGEQSFGVQIESADADIFRRGCMLSPLSIDVQREASLEASVLASFIMGVTVVRPIRLVEHSRLLQKIG